MKTSFHTFALTKLMIVLPCICVFQAAQAATEHWIGVPGVSADTNWSDASNWSSPQQTYYNQVQFIGIGANANNNTAVNNVLDVTTTGPAQMPIWELDYVPTNGNYTTLILPGVTMQTGAGNGNLKVGADQVAGSAAPANAVETVKIEGPGATLSMSPASNNGLNVGQGSAAPSDTHNVTLDLSGLDNFKMIAPSGGANSYIYLASSGGNNKTNLNGVLYLAKTNNIALGAGIQMCNQSSSSYSNSQPVMLFLGINNTITLGSSGNFNIGQTGTSTNGAIVEFNPAFLGGATPPTAFLNGGASGGRINNLYVCNISDPIPGYALCNFSGGSVNALIGTLEIGASSSGVGAAVGVLTFDMGTINASSAYVGRQQSSGGGMAVGTVNINSNSQYGASATFTVGGTLSLAAVTGTLTPGTAGTININGGTLSAGSITTGSGASAITNNGGTLTLSGTGGTAASPITSLSLSNSTLNLSLPSTPTSQTNIIAASLATGGTTNIINISSVPLTNNVPVQIPLIQYGGAIGGTGYNFGLGTLPLGFSGYLVNNTAAGQVDLVLTAIPYNEIWSAAQNNNWDTTSTNWQIGGVLPNTTYVDGDVVSFLDGAASGTVNLTAIFNPSGMTVSNNALAYTWSSSGAISGATALTKQGPGTFIIDNSGINSFSGGVTISGGILQVGNGDANGNLPSGNVADNGILAFDRTDNPIISDPISGSGAVVQAGGGTLQLAGFNSFSGPVVVTNNSTLQLGSSTAAGAGTNAITVASGSTLDVDGNTATKPVVVSGTGVSGSGALTSSGAPYINLATNITLVGDTAFLNNSPNRWDLNSGTLGGAYNLTLNGNGAYFQWGPGLQVNNVANITVASGSFGLVDMTTLGDPSATLAIAPGAQLVLYGGDVVNKAVDLQSTATIANAGANSANIMMGPMSIDSLEYLSVGGTSLTLSNSLSGSGILQQQNSSSGTTILAGNSPSFNGLVELYGGQLALDGLIGCGINTSLGTVLYGTGTADGLVDVSGAFTPGGASTPGTFNAAGGLTIESGATVTMNLGTATTPGGGINSLVNVTGPLTFNGNNFNITINPLKGYLADGTYTLFTCTGTLTVNGTLTASTASPSVYSFTVVTNATQVLLTVSGQGNLLKWNNNANNGQWDINTSVNWTNLTTLTNSVYLNPDTVVFDDTITQALNPTTSITIPSGAVVVPAVVTNNSTINYTISGPGKISGPASIVKLGSSTLTIGNTNDFTGNLTVGAGTVELTGASPITAAGAENGALIISNGATLLVNLTNGNNGFFNKPIVVSGTGVNANGAIQFTGNSLYSGATWGGLGQNITLAGNASFSSTTRFDWGYAGAGTTLSSGGSNYNLTASIGAYSQWEDIGFDTNLGNIDLYTSAGSLTEYLTQDLGLGLGNPTNILTLHSNVELYIGNGTYGYDSGFAKVVHILPTAEWVFQPSGGAGDYRLNTSFILENGANLFQYSVSGGSGSGLAYAGTVTLNGLAHIEIGNAPITFSNVISGVGGFYVDNYGGYPLVFAAANTYQGITDIRSGIELSLVGNGSISSSTPISLANGGSGPAALLVSNRVDGTLTLAGGQTLEGGGIVMGILNAGAGSTLLPGVTSTATNLGTLSVSGNAALAGNILMKLNLTTNDVLSVGGTLTYGGTLTVTNISATPLAAGNTFKLFSAAGYSGSFIAISPATPGSGLVWNTGNLAVNGTLSVASAAPPRITSVAVNGTALTITAANGPANAQYVLMESTNLLAPLPWTPVLTNNFSGTGTINLTTNIINPGVPVEFYILQTP